MNDSSPLSNAGAWLGVILICASVTYAGGYFVATDQAMSGLKQREAEWDAQTKAAKTRDGELSRKLAEVTAKLKDRERELKDLRLKSESLQQQAKQAQIKLRSVEQLQEQIDRLEEAVTLKAAQLDAVNKLLAKKDALALDAFERQSPLTLKQIVTAKNAFHDIQHEVAAGNYKGLNLTNGYQRLKAIFENPDLDDLTVAYDEIKQGGQ